MEAKGEGEGGRETGINGNEKDMKILELRISGMQT